MFGLTISVTSVTTFDHTDCDLTLRTLGSRVTVFRSRRPTPVRFVGGRLRTVVVRGLQGNVKETGTNVQSFVCDGTSPAPEPCEASTRTFSDARVTFSSTAAGSITIQPPRVALQGSDCPLEPDAVVALPLGLAPAPLHISLATLTNPRITRITLSASARRTKNYGPPEAGFVQQRTTWTLTLARRGR